MDSMVIFNADTAIFGAVTGTLLSTLEDSFFDYINPASTRNFGVPSSGIKVVDLLALIVGDKDVALLHFQKLLSDGSILCEGELNGRDVQYHSMIDSQEKRIQAAIIDTTESRRAKEGFEYTSAALARASEVNDEDTGKHIIRINHYSAKMASLMGLDETCINNLFILGQLHDVGKIHIPPAILSKPGRLTTNEFEIMKKHTVYGAKIIGDHDRLSVARQIALSHHEKWDGTGYPNNLSGESIPLSGKIVAMVDVFDALLSKRTYKRAFSYEETFDILTCGDDRLTPKNHFDPKIHRLFIDNYHVFTNIHKGLRDPE